MNSKKLWIIAALMTVMILVFAAGCTGQTGTATPTPTATVTGTTLAATTAPSAEAPTQVATTGETEIVVYAAASLTGAVTDIANAFMEENKDIKVTTNFAGSQTLKTQLLEGGIADMYISANSKQFDPVVENGLIGEKKILLKNKLAIAVPKENKANIQSLADLSKSGVVLVIGNKDVPFGQYTQQIIGKYNNASAENAGYVEKFMANVVSEVDAVDKIKPVLQLGEADASIVYKSDVSKDDQKYITLIEIPDEYNVIASYPYGILDGTEHTNEITKFNAYLTGPKGTAILKGYGFDVE